MNIRFYRFGNIIKRKVDPHYETGLLSARYTKAYHNLIANVETIFDKNKEISDVEIDIVCRLGRIHIVSTYNYWRLPCPIDVSKINGVDINDFTTS